MRFIVKLFAEITIKSDSVRRKMVQHLIYNLQARLREDAPGCVVIRHWDRLDIIPPEGLQTAALNVLVNTPGISHVLEAEDVPNNGMDDLIDTIASQYAERIAGKSFRCTTERSGKTDFTSVEFNRALGARLLELCPTSRVDLQRPEVVVRTVIRGNPNGRLDAWHILARHEGLGGYPLGAVGTGLSLISGGYDSSVATWYAIRRGLLPHFCIFRLGGEAHVTSVLPQVYMLWQRYLRSHNPRLVIVPFEDVADALKTHTDPGLMGVMLKRIMFKAAERIAHKAGAQALITGESLAQVASQTLTNLNRIDNAVSLLVIRPLITMHKQDIIKQAERLGLAHHAACTSEYCGALIDKPHAAVSQSAIDKAEAAFPWEVLDAALDQAEILTVKTIPERAARQSTLPVVSKAGEGIVIDLREPAESERNPLAEASLALPYAQLDERTQELPRDRALMLYCSRGLLSVVAGERLQKMGYDVRIYQPETA